MNKKSNVNVKTTTRTDQRFSVSMALIAIVAVLTIGSTASVYVFAQQQGSNPPINCSPIYGNPFAHGCPGNGQWTYPSPGIVCNRGTGMCMHLSS